MADSMKFSRINQPTSIGTACWTCNTSSHPEQFVQLNGKHVQAYGTVALCVGCVYELGRVAGMLAPAEAAVKDGQLEEMSAVNEELASALAAERENKTVPLAEVLDYFEERERRRPDEPKPVTQPKKAS